MMPVATPTRFYIIPCTYFSRKQKHKDYHLQVGIYKLQRLDEKERIDKNELLESKNGFNLNYLVYLSSVLSTLYNRFTGGPSDSICHTFDQEIQIED